MGSCLDLWALLGGLHGVQGCESWGMIPGSFASGLLICGMTYSLELFLQLIFVCVFAAVYCSRVRTQYVHTHTRTHTHIYIYIPIYLNLDILKVSYQNIDGWGRKLRSSRRKLVNILPHSNISKVVHLFNFK